MEADKKEEFINKIFNQIRLVCEREMGIVFSDEPSKEMEEWTAKLVKEMVDAIKADINLKA